MNKLAVAACTLCFALAVQAEEKMTCGQMIKAQSVLPAKMSEVMAAVTTYYDQAAADLATLKSKEAKAEATELKKLAKMHSEMGAKMKAAAAEMAKQDTAMAATPDHPTPSAKLQTATTDLLTKEKEMIALIQKDVDETEKMMKEMKDKSAGAKAGGAH